MIHTPGWVHLGVGTLFMKEDNIVVVMESVDVDTMVEAETAACSLKVNGDIGDNHRGVAPNTMKQLQHKVGRDEIHSCCEARLCMGPTRTSSWVL